MKRKHCRMRSLRQQFPVMRNLSIMFWSIMPPYIEELCKRKIKLADGREHDQVDEFMKLRIRAKLIEKIVNFKILLE